MSAPLLAVSGLETAYGPSQVLFGIDLEIQPGEVIGLLGRNGMGKSTLVRSIMGLTPARAGQIRIDGEQVRGQRADRIARLGLSLVPEGRQVFPNLTVEEHLTAFARRPPAHRDQPVWDPARVYRLFPRLAERRAHLGHHLSGGEQQMLAIGRALVTHPRLLILDEATEGLAPLIREEIWRCLQTLRQEGQTLLVIDKYVARLLKIADRHVILERGRVAWTGRSDELGADHSVWQRLLGV